MKNIVYILALGAFGIITTELGVVGVMPDIANTFRIHIETAGWLLSGFALTIAVTGPVIVLSTSRFDRKWMMALVLLVFVISNTMSFYAQSFGMLMAARILPAFLHPVFWAAATVAAARMAGPVNAPKAVAVVFAGLSIASVLGVPVTTYAASLYGWRASFLLAGAINFMAFVLLIALMPAMKGAEKTAPVSAQLVIFRNKFLWLNLLMTILVLAGMFATFSYLATFLTVITKMNVKTVSMMLLIFGTAGIIGNWLVGRALSIWPMATYRLFLLLLIIVHLLAYVAGTSLLFMCTLMLLWGFVHTSGFLISNIRTTNEAAEAPELGSSLMISFGNAGLALGTWLGGWVIKGYGVRKLTWASAVLLLAALLLSFLESRRKQPLNEQNMAAEGHPSE